MIEKKDISIIQSFFEDNSNLKGGYAQNVLMPENQDEVPKIIKEANHNSIPLTISGSGTGTVGGRIPFGGSVVSTEMLNKILALQFNDSKEDAYIRVEAGVLLNDLLEAVSKKGLFYPPNPTEKSASIGGTISTNASGSRSFKYGPTRNYVDYLKVVTGSGELLEIKRGQIISKGRKFDFTIEDKKFSFCLPTYNMPSSKKHSAGFYIHDDMDLIDLFIGQEGVLGVAIEAKLRLIKAADNIFSCFAFFNNEDDIWKFVNHAVDIGPMALEYFDSNSLNLLRKQYPHIPDQAKGCIFFEQEITLNNEEEIMERWLVLLEKYGVNSDSTWVGSNAKEREKFYEFRHRLPDLINEMLKKRGLPKVATDIALSNDAFFKMLDFYLRVLKSSGIDYLIFGHVGDCHLHVNLLPKTIQELESSKRIASEFIDKAIFLGGTVSGEHGIGKIKHMFLEKLYGRDGINQMIELKRVFDPKFILNRNNMFLVP